MQTMLTANRAEGMLMHLHHFVTRLSGSGSVTSFLGAGMTPLMVQLCG